MLVRHDRGGPRGLACICHCSLVPPRVSYTLSTSVFNSSIININTCYSLATASLNMSNHTLPRDHGLELHNIKRSVSPASASLARAPSKNANHSNPDFPNIESANGSTQRDTQLEEPDGIPPPNPNGWDLRVDEAGAPSNRTVRYALTRIVH